LFVSGIDTSLTVHRFRMVAPMRCHPQLCRQPCRKLLESRETTTSESVGRFMVLRTDLYGAHSASGRKPAHDSLTATKLTNRSMLYACSKFTCCAIHVARVTSLSSNKMHKLTFSVDIFEVALADYMQFVDILVYIHPLMQIIIMCQVIPVRALPYFA